MGPISWVRGFGRMSVAITVVLAVAACGADGTPDDGDRPDGGDGVLDGGEGPIREDAGRVPDAGPEDGGTPPSEVTVTSPPGLDSDVFRENALIAVLPDGRVWVAGGVIARPPPGGGLSRPTGREEVEVIDPDTGTFTLVPPLAQGRYLGAVTRLPNGSLLVTGGIGGPPGEIGEARDTAEVIDGTSFESTLLEERMTIPRAGHLAWLVEGGPHDGKVMLFGGADPPSAETYDPETGTFSSVPVTGAPEGFFQSIALLPDGRVLLTGVNIEDEGQVGCYVFDPDSGMTTATGSMNASRRNHTVTVLADGRVLAVGGENLDGVVVPTAELWDAESGDWTLTGENPGVARSFHAAASLGSGRVVVAGGRVGTRETTDTVEVFDPTTGGFATADTTLSERRYRLQAVPLRDGRVLVIGGCAIAPGAGEFILSNVDLIGE